MNTLIVLAVCCATVPAVLWVWNMLIYREPQAGSCAQMGHCVLPDAVSVLIPARNEERVIGASIGSLLASRGVKIEIVVLDDGSTDRTAEIVRELRGPGFARAPAVFCSSTARLEWKAACLPCARRGGPLQCSLLPRRRCASCT